MEECNHYYDIIGVGLRQCRICGLVDDEFDTELMLEEAENLVIDLLNITRYSKTRASEVYVQARKFVTKVEKRRKKEAQK